MTNDDSTREQPGALAYAMPSLQSLRKCAFCHEARHSRGSRLIGPMRRFMCSQCVSLAPIAGAKKVGQ